MESSTATIGRSRSLPRKGHRMLTHLIRRFLGAFAGGVSLNELMSNGVPHHGHVSSGIGGMRVSLARYFSVRRRAVSSSLSPTLVLPIRFGVADFPTHNPISKGHSPRLRSRSVCRISRSEGRRGGKEG